MAHRSSRIHLPLFKNVSFCRIVVCVLGNRHSNPGVLGFVVLVCRESEYGAKRSSRRWLGLTTTKYVLVAVFIEPEGPFAQRGN